MYTPLSQSTDPRMENREARFIQVIGRLASGVSANQAEAEVMLISRRLAEEYPKSNAGVSPMSFT